MENVEEDKPADAEPEKNSMKYVASLGAMLALMGGPPALAQESGGPRLPAGPAFGVTMDRFDVGRESGHIAATVHVSGLKPNQLSSEFAVSVFPRFLLARVLVTNLDVGANFNLSFPRATLLIRGGASGLFALGGGAVALPGLHLGASLLIKADERGAFRLDLIHRTFYRQDGVAVPSLTIGAGFTLLPAIR